MAREPTGIIAYGVANTANAKNQVRKALRNLDPSFGCWMEGLTFVNDKVTLQRKLDQRKPTQVIYFTDDDETFDVLNTVKYDDAVCGWLARPSADAFRNYTNVYPGVEWIPGTGPLILDNFNAVNKGFRNCLEYSGLGASDIVGLRDKDGVASFGFADKLKAYTNAFSGIEEVRNQTTVSLPVATSLVPVLGLSTDLEGGQQYLYSEALMKLSQDLSKRYFIHTLTNTVAAITELDGKLTGYTDAYQIALAGLPFIDESICSFEEYWLNLGMNAVNSMNYYGRSIF